MNYIEIVLEDIQKKYLDEILGEIIRFDICDIISSHFFDTEHNQDIDFQKIISFESSFCDSGTGNLFLKKVRIGIELEKVIIIISCNEKMGDITINFSEDQFKDSKNPQLKNSIQKLLQILLEIQNKYFVSKIFVGYEPATDDDMKILEFNQGHIKICNEEFSQSFFAQLLYNTLK